MSGQAAKRILLNRLVERVNGLPPTERKIITQLAKDTAAQFPQMGELHALELIYKLVTWLNENAPRLPGEPPPNGC